MALKYSSLVIFVVISVPSSMLITVSVDDGRTTDNAESTTLSSVEVKRRNMNIVDETFLEQKDVLLDMLESKLKNVLSKKKKQSSRTENAEEVNCDLLPNDVNLQLQAKGIVGVGETDVQLKYGETGNSTLNLEATGLSNVGKVKIELGVADGNIYIPGLENLFNGPSFLKGPCKIRNASMLNPAPENKKDLENKLSFRSYNSDNNDTLLTDNTQLPQSDIKIDNGTLVLDKLNDSKNNMNDANMNEIMHDKSSNSTVKESS